MMQPVAGYVSTCTSKTCGDSGIAIRPDADNFPCFTGVEAQPWMDATSIRVDATALSGDVNVNFRHQSVTDITSFDAAMNSYSSSCSCQGCPLCPQVLVTPSTISRTACSATDCEDGGIHIAAASEFYNATSKQWAVTLEPSCFGDIPGAAPATATASALLLAVVCGVAALPLLPLRVLFGGVRAVAVSGGGTTWWRAAAAGGAALGLAVVLLASGEFNDAAGSGGADALESCGCGATDGLKELTVTFYHAPGVLVDGASAAGMSSTYGTRVHSGVIDVNCTSNATGTASSCWTVEGVGNSSADGAVCAPNAGWNNGCMEGRPLVVETGGEALRAAVQWEAVPRASLPSTSAAAMSPPSSWWVPYLAEHLDSLDIGAVTVHTDGSRGAQATTPVNAVARTLSVQRWVEQGRDEHASVASFNRFSLGLMARGAPPGLVRRAQQAALDETKHAELSFSLAAALNATANGATAAGDESGSVWVPTPGPIVLPNPLPLDTSNEAMLRAAFREGCIGELNAAARAAAELKTLQRWQDEQCGAEHIASTAAVACIHATHAAAALAAIADEEAGHAVLAWQSAGWLLGLGSASNTTLDAVLAEELHGYLTRAAAGGAVDAVVAVSVVAKLAPLVQDAGAGDAVELPSAIVDSYAAAVAAAGAGDPRSADVLAGVEQLWAAVLARWQ